MLLSEASATYLRARRAEGYSPATLRQYAYQLQRFAVGPVLVLLKRSASVTSETSLQIRTT